MDDMMLASCQENLPETRVEERGVHAGTPQRVPAVRPQVKAHLLYLARDEGHIHGTKTVFVPPLLLLESLQIVLGTYSGSDVE